MRIAPRLWLVLLLSLVALPAQAGPRVDCDVRFAGSSTLHDFAGTAPRISFDLDTAPQPGQWDAEISIPVVELATGNSMRDARMREMFDSDRWPQIRAKFAGIDPDLVASTRELPMTLTIRDTTRQRVGRLVALSVSRQRTEVDVEVDVSLRDFELEAPRVLGFVRVDDHVVIRARAVIAAALGPTDGTREERQ